MKLKVIVNSVHKVPVSSTIMFLASEILLQARWINK